MKCPICRESSRCGNPAGDPGVSCWCYTAGFPKQIFELIPDEERRKACICPSCLAAFKEGRLERKTGVNSGAEPKDAGPPRPTKELPDDRSGIYGCKCGRTGES